MLFVKNYGSLNTSDTFLQKYFSSLVMLKANPVFHTLADDSVLFGR